MDRLIKCITGGNIRVDVYTNLVFPRNEIHALDRKESFYEEEDLSPKIQFPLNWTKLNYPYIRNDDDVKSKDYNVIINDDFFAGFCKKLYNDKKRLTIKGSELFRRTGERLNNSHLPALLNFLTKNKDVVSVSLPYNRIDSEGFKTIIDHLLVNPNILELNLQSNDIETRGIDYLFEVGENLQLMCLRLNGNKLGTEGSKKIALLLLKNSCLRHLDVADIDQTASSLVYFLTVIRLDQKPHNNNLKILDISRPIPDPMYYFDSEHIASSIGAMLKNNKSLSELRLQKFGLYCHDIETLMMDAKYNNTLRLLDLSCNNIGDYGVENLATWLAKRPALKGLILARNIITDHGASSLSRNIPFSRLILLDLSYNKITDDGMTNVLYTLKKSPPMQCLRMFGNNIGHSTATIIQRMLTSQVLKQENIDIKPYRIDHKWYIAYYPSNNCKEGYYDVPRYSSIKSLKASTIIKPEEKLGSCFSSMDLKFSKLLGIQDVRRDANFVCKCDTQKTEAMKKSHIFQSDTTIGTNNSYECTCNSELIEEEREERSDSPSYMKTGELPHADEFKFDPTGKIPLILNRVSPDTKRNILRWINIDENVLEEDLKKQEVSSETSEDEEKDLCHCSWIRFKLSPRPRFSLEESVSESNMKV